MNQRTSTQSPWYVYIVQCSDNTYYTGITTDLKRRLLEHNSQKLGARYTRPRQPVKMVYQEPAQSRSAAASREYHIRKLTPIKKRKLIVGLLPEQSPETKSITP